MLVAGTAIGVGMLALPTFTLPSGVVPSSIMLVVVWFYLLISGLLSAEVTLNAIRNHGLASSGVVVIIEQTLGKLGAQFALIVYLFFNYALLVAYVAKGGEILVGAIPITDLQNVLSGWSGTAFAILFGGMMYLGREKLVEKLNSVFVGIFIATFLGLLFFAGSHIHGEYFFFQDWSAIGSTISVMLVAQFYHNVVPVIVTQLEGDAGKVRLSILIGSIIPLVMFLVWNGMILGSVSPDMIGVSVFDPLEILRSGIAGEWLGVLISVFSLFAIATSFIGCVYGLQDFWKDIFKEKFGKFSLYSLILLPPVGLSALNTGIFFIALDYAGTFCVSILAGIIPPLMVWKQREVGKNSSVINQRLVGGGKVTLIMMIGIALILIIKQFF
jgi:tyrosine-specific transport protein